MQIYSREFEFAQRNGFGGTHAQYIELQYQGYVTICAHNDIVPASREQWKNRHVLKEAGEDAESQT